MSDENLILIAFTVFILMIVGLVLTALEFRYGEPHRQQKKAKRQAQGNPYSQGV